MFQWEKAAGAIGDQGAARIEIKEEIPVYSASSRADLESWIARYRYEATPLKTAAEPLFRLMPEPKRLVLFEGGHMPPVELTLRTIGPWLDEMLGPVRRE